IKYGITLGITSGVGYTSKGANIYNYTTHAINIAGVARDLDNGFNQRRSRSSNAGAVVEMEGSATMKNGSYLVWGKDGGSAIVIQTNEIPSHYDERIQAEYRVAVTGEPGAVTVKIHIGNLPQYDRRSKTANFYSLLISGNNNFNTINDVVTAAELIDDTLIFQNVSFSNGDHFTLAVPAIPSIGVNNSLWLRADKGLTRSGNQVSAWADQSGSNNNASQGTVGSRPILMENAINGNNALAFNGKTIGGAAGFYTREYFILADPDVTYSSSSSPGYLAG